MTTKIMTPENKTIPQLIIKRIFNAPKAEVWKFWSDPDCTKQWWGPKTFTTPVITMDFKVGGKYHICMRSADGKDFWSTGRYLEIIKNEKIVATDSFSDAEGNIVPAEYYGFEGKFPLELKMTISLEDSANHTLITLVHEGLPEGKHSEDAKTGWNESFDKLAEVL